MRSSSPEMIRSQQEAGQPRPAGAGDNFFFPFNHKCQSSASLELTQFLQTSSSHGVFRTRPNRRLAVAICRTEIGAVMPPRKRGAKSSKGNTKRPNSPKLSQPVPVPSKKGQPHPDLPLAPIQKSPRDVLLIIFEFYLAENPRYIRRLVLVCKQ